MRRLDHYVSAEGRLLRCGYTTGTCAAAATRAAAELLVGGTCPPAVLVDTPQGIDVLVEVEECARGEGWAAAAVRKDGGDDPDVTDGVTVWARVARADEPGVVIEGGAGVGRVTRPGLDQPVGAAAINSVPRAMIRAAVTAAAGGGTSADGEAAGVGPCGGAEGYSVEISIPGGEELAASTMNPRLGIEGGLSVLGTSGIVRPMSADALVSSIKLELSQMRARGVCDLVLVPGNYGCAFACHELGLLDESVTSCSNYLGAALDEAALLGFASVLVVGHIGKMAKVASGAMNTHSRVADGRMEALAAHAALVGATAADVACIMDAATTDAVLGLLEARGLLRSTMDSLMLRLGGHLRHRVAGRLAVEAVVFSRALGLLGMTEGARELLARHAGPDARGSGARGRGEGCP